MRIQISLLTAFFCLAFAFQAIAEEEIKPVEVKAKKSYEVMEPKPGVHSCSVTNMPANSACAGTIKEGSWESKLTYRSMTMGKLYNGSAQVTNPQNRKMDVSMTMAMLSYGVNDNLLVAGMIPTVSKSMTSTMMNANASGLSDISLVAKWKIWSDGDVTTPPRAFDDLREKGNSVALFAGVKAPTGANDVKNAMGTARLLEPMQPGTGSWDYRVGASYSRDMNPFWIHASAFYNLNGTNSFGYQFGNRTEYNLALQFEPWINTVLNLELNGESRAADISNGTTLSTTTGSDKLFLTPGFQYQFNDNWDLEAGYSMPISMSVTGTQLADDSRWFLGFRGAIL